MGVSEAFSVLTLCVSLCKSVNTKSVAISGESAGVLDRGACHKKLPKTKGREKKSQRLVAGAFDMLTRRLGTGFAMLATVAAAGPGRQLMHE